MDKQCVICSKTARYKCPKCYIYYCSVSCCKEHRNDNCVEKKSCKEDQEVQRIEEEKRQVKESFGIPKEKLQLLDNDKELKNLLANKHLRDLLMIIDKAENAEKIMQEAMQEPIFVEFADACLKVVDPKTDDEH